MAQKVVYVVAALIRDEQGRVLLAQRPAHKPLPFLWELPGGKIEEGETPEEALARELEEELGMTVDPATLSPFTFVRLPHPTLYLIMLVYHCQSWVGVPFAREGQGGIEWVPVQDMHRYPMPEGDRPLVALLQGESA